MSRTAEIIKKAAVLLLLTAVAFAMSGTVSFAEVTSAKTPVKNNYGSMKWSFKQGSGYANAPTPPVIYKGEIYIGVDDKIIVLNKETGAVERKSGPLTDTFDYSTVPLTISEVDGKGVIFAPLSDGQVQALDADTLKSLWITEKVSGQSTISPILCDGAYIYVGMWKSDEHDGYYKCYSTKDADTSVSIEKHTAKWTVTQSGGFYWAGACITQSKNNNNKYVVFASEDGKSSDSKTGAKLYCCKAGGNYSSGTAVTDSKDIIGDARSTVTYDSSTDAYYFTTKGGYLYEAKINEDGKITSLDNISLGGASTGKPVIYNGVLYIGVRGDTLGSKGRIQAIKLSDNPNEGMSAAGSGTTPGYVQSELLLSAAEGSSGDMYIYSTSNKKPGGISISKVTENGSSVGDADPLFTPPVKYQQYCLAPAICDDNGTIYYKNDSCAIMAVEPGYMCYSEASAGGSITASRTVAEGGSASFNIIPSDGCRISSVLIDGVDAGAVTGKTFLNVTAPHSIYVKFAGIPPKAVKLSTKSGKRKITVKWESISKATGYVIYRSTRKTKNYRTIKTINKSGIRSWTNKKLKKNKKYFYKIKTYRTLPTGNAYSVFSNISYKKVK